MDPKVESSCGALSWRRTDHFIVMLFQDTDSTATCIHGTPFGEEGFREKSVYLVLFNGILKRPLENAAIS